MRVVCGVIRYRPAPRCYLSPIEGLLYCDFFLIEGSTELKNLKEELNIAEEQLDQVEKVNIRYLYILPTHQPTCAFVFQKI